jgi:hypothetical protein
MRDQSKAGRRAPPIQIDARLDFSFKHIQTIVQPASGGAAQLNVNAVDIRKHGEADAQTKNREQIN